MQVREMPPFAPVLMESTRAIGYSLEAAIADIIDNSIAAKADKIQLFFFPVADAYVSILDNGSGMDDAQIDVAMQYGSKSPTDMRDATDLGRYGLGLKTASLSQCRVLTVISKQGNTIIGRRWDLDYVIGTGRWSLLVLEQDDIAQAPHIEDLKEQENGTLVIWQTLDRLLMGEVDYEKSLGRKMDDVRQHLGLVFHRYLLGEAGIKRLEISFNGVKINAAELKPKAFVMENVSMLKSDVHRFYMEEGDVETVKKYKIPVKSTPLHLLDAEYMFEGALDILKDQQKIQQYLWPEQHYFELNVIYKATKNLEKMKSTLEKHKKKLCATAGDYAKSSDNSHISNVSKSAFQAILSILFLVCDTASNDGNYLRYILFRYGRSSNRMDNLLDIHDSRYSKQLF